MQYSEQAVVTGFIPDPHPGTCYRVYRAEGSVFPNPRRFDHMPDTNALALSAT